MSRKNKAVIYARESSKDTKKAPPINKQIERAKQLAEVKGWEITKVYQDNGYSGGDWKRPSWNKLIKDAKFHKFNVVITWHRNRIARDTEQFLFFNRSMKESYVKVFTVVDNSFIDLENVGDTAKNISLAMADEIMRKVTSEKVKRVYAMKKRKAEKKGHKIRWGRQKKKLDLEKMIEMRNKGLGYREIAKHFDCSYQTVRRRLQKPHIKERLNNSSKEPKNND